MSSMPRPPDNLESDLRTASILCTCTRCRSHPDWDSANQVFLKGRYVGCNERKAHIRADIGAEMVAQHVYARSLPSQTPSTAVNHSRIKPPNNAGSTEAGEEALKLVLPNSVIQRLCKIESKLKGALLDVLPHDVFLIFQHPPDRHCSPMETPNNAMLLLQGGVESNEIILAQEQWLESAKSFLQDLCLIASTQSNYISDLQQLRDRIDRKLAYWERFKMAHWEVQRTRASQISMKAKICKTSECH
ncbi:hypothetical protein CVT26_001468 [Gymnopilus dilepis]|uniref:Uncharacterized protein n=1 Tax=Gymnopilus dilepis TaxID=231916 RepID=A0A409WEE2_9AGAR|nr:hypothetical protein CVT26_001468 [Gymnopilus dilepis]